MNSAQLIGNLARDPEIRFTKTGKAVASFTVAVSRSYTPQGSQEAKQLTDFISVVAWGNLGEACGNYLGKGSRVFVEGRIGTRSYEAKDGTKRYVTEVIADFVGSSVLKTKKDSSSPSPAPSQASPLDKYGTTSDEEIPF